MKAITATWFECKVKYEHPMDDGSTKEKPENFVIDALSFTDAEEKIMEEVSVYSTGSVSVEGIKKTVYKEIFFTDNPNADRWYLAKADFIVMDEKTAKEKHNVVPFLVQAETFSAALNNFQEVLGQGMSDYKIVSIVESKIFDVIQHRLDNQTQPDAKPEYEQ